MNWRERANHIARRCCRTGRLRDRQERRLRWRDRVFQLPAGELQGIPNVVVVMFCSSCCSSISSPRARRSVVESTRVGGNERRRLSGIKTNFLTFYTFVTMGVMAALGGLVRGAFNTATPKAGDGMELDVIAAALSAAHRRPAVSARWSVR